jgi:hypothetical protein
MLVLDDLHSGKLVAPFGFGPTQRKLVLWIAPHLDGRPDVEALAKWLAGEMKASERAPSAEQPKDPRAATARPHGNRDKTTSASSRARSRHRPD